MRRIKRLLAVAIPLVSVFSILAPTPAQASTIIVGGAVATGSGTITPGLTPLTPQGQAVTFTGRVTGAVAAVSNPPANLTGTVGFDMSCVFNGGSNGPETSLEGEGTVTGNCNGLGVFDGVQNGNVIVGTGTVSVTCNLQYYRKGGEVLVSGNCTATATVANVLGSTATVTTNFCAVGEFEFVPTSNPTTSYVLAGAVESYSSKVGACPQVKTLP